MIYICLFFLITFLTFVSEKIYKKSKAGSYVLSGLCIFLLSLFAGLRAFDVGLDVEYYGVKFFDYAFSFNKFWNYYHFVQSDLLYLLINYVFSKFTTNYHFVLFFLQLIPSVMIYKIAYKEKDKSNMWFFILIYLLLWYNSSLNVLRQTISMLTILYCYKYLEQGSWFKYIIGVVIAYFFHSSAFVFIFLPLLYKMNNNKKQKKLNIFLIIVFVLIVAFYDKLILLAIRYNIVPHRFIAYLSSGVLDFNILESIFKILLLIVIYSFSKYYNKDFDNKFLYLTAFIELLLFELCALNKFAVRLSYYFLLHLVILLPRIDYSLRNAKGRNLYRVTVIIILLLRWVLRNYLWGYDGTIPYSFFWK